MRPTTLFVLLVLAFCQISGVFSNPLPRKPYPPETLRNPWISSRNTYATKYRAMRVWFEGRRGWCFRFNGDSGRTTATVDGSNARTGTVIFPRYQDGKSAGFPIFDKIPTDQGYSDAWSAKVVVVPGWYKPNRVRNVEALIASGFPQSVVGVYNFALVPKGSKLVDWNNKEISTSIRNGWYKGNRVRYFDFGAIQIDAQSVAVPLSNAFVVVDSKGPKGSPIFSSIPGPGPYTGFYSLKTYRVADSIAADSIRSPPPVDDPNVTKEGIALNCPLVFVEQAALDPTKPIPKPPTSIGTLPKPAIPPAKSNSYFNGPPAYFTTVPVFYNNRAAFCWPFGSYSARGLYDFSAVLTNEVLLPVYTSPAADGSPRLAGRPVFKYLPGHPMYSDAASTSFVFVEDTRALDEFKTFDALKNMKFRETFSGVANLPLVPRNSEIFPDNNYDLSATKFGVPVRREAWFGGRLVNYFDLGPIKSTESATYVKAAPAVYNSEGQTIVSAIPENAATYTGFYGVGRAKAGQLSLTFSEYDTTGFTANMGINNCPIAAIA